MAANTSQKQSSAGFTIVEVIVVLAIAGIILGLVIKVIPALQRSSRNNDRKHDVGLILQQVSHYELNNSAVFPPPITAIANFMGSTPQLKYYKNNGTAIVAWPGLAPTTTPASTNIDVVTIYSREICDPNGGGVANSANAGFRDIVAVYAIETAGGGTGPQCTQL